MNNETDNINNNENNMGRRKQGRRGNGFGGVTLRGNVYYARYTDSLGNRKEVSTHTSNREEALKVLATFTNPIRESNSTEEVKLRLQQSIEVLELRKDLKNIDRVKLCDLPEKFIGHRVMSDSTEGTKIVYRNQLKKLVDVIANRYPNVKNVDDVTLEVAENVMGDLTSHYTPTVYNLSLATYRRAWGMFSRSNPFLKIGKRKIDKSRHRMNVGEDDVKRIFNACRNDRERAVWATSIYTGLRCVDVCHLKYGDLSSNLDTLTCMPQKTKRHMSEPLVIPVCEPLKNALLKVLDFNKIGNETFKGEYLWSDYVSKYASGFITRWFKATLEKAGLETSKIDENGHHQILTGFHICRHFFISIASRYMSPLLVQKIVGHSTLEMTAHYHHTNQEELREGLEQMPDLIDGKNKKVDGKGKTPDEEALDLLNSMKRDGESSLDCLKRLIAGQMRLVG